MKPWIFLPIAVVVAIPSRGLFAGEDAREDVIDGNAGTLALVSRLETLTHELVQLESSKQRLSDRLTARRPGSSSPANALDASSPTSDAAIASAVAHWLESHPSERAALIEEVKAATGAPKTAGSQLSVGDLMLYFAERAPFDGDAQVMYQELRDAGRMDEFVSAVEAFAAANPEDSEAQTALGVAYLQKLFGLGATPEAGMAANQADNSFDRALELDPSNVDARFTKAIALSNWPDFMGKTGEALNHFEILRRQVEGTEIEGDFSQLYLVLGNMYQRVKEFEKASEAWNTGLLFYPANEELREQLELNTHDATDADG